MRQQITMLFVLSGFLLLALQVKGQKKDSSDKSWPALGSSEKAIYENRPRFMIESSELQPAPVESAPSWVPRCPPADICITDIRAGHFFSEWKSDMQHSTLRPDVVMHHYPYALFDGHFRSTGTYVFYIPGRNMFYLWGDCAMGHPDTAVGPFAGDPRLVLKKLADDPEAVAILGAITVPFQVPGQGREASDDAWPDVPNSGIDVTRLEAAQNLFNPLSLDRCRDSSEPCVVNMDDFFSTRTNRSRPNKSVLRSDVIAHYYPGYVQKYVFYLPSQNIFYVAGYSQVPRFVVSGPFAGDPRLVLKKLTEDAK